MTIVFSATPVPWTLLFKTTEAYNNAIISFKNPATFDSQYFDLTDDFGQRVSIKRDAIQGVMFEELAKSKLAHIERGLHQYRIQVEANNMGRADPMISEALRQAQRAQMQGPPVIQPFSNGPFRQ
jgi:hypothetical protein